MMVDYIDQHRGIHGVEPICRQLPIAPATYYEHKAKQREPERRSRRVIRDEDLTPEVRRVWDENFQVYGVRKVWHPLHREDVSVARCTVARLMRAQGLRGAVRGKKARTTVPDEALDRPLDQVNRQFGTDRPNALWVADLTYVDRGSQYLAIRYADRLAEIGISPSVGSVGDSYDNALAETINGLYKTEVIRHQGPWRNLEEVEFATLAWVDWFNHRRLLEPIGNVPPAEKEAAYYRQLTSQAQAA